MRTKNGLEVFDAGNRKLNVKLQNKQFMIEATGIDVNWRKS